VAGLLGVAGIGTGCSGRGARAMTENGYPAREVWNRSMRAVLYLPDATNGYYRGSRFDWSGMFAQVTVRGHTYFGELRPERNPLGNDNVCGPAEEFGMNGPLGFGETPVGGTFLKIGVGTLQKSESSWLFHHNYPVVKPLDWQVYPQADPVGWVFSASDSHTNGFAYEYTKVVEMHDSEPILLIRHTLRNCGTRPIETDHYSHNMLRLDNLDIGPDYLTTFPFVPSTNKVNPELAISNQTVRIVTDPFRGPVFQLLEGFSKGQSPTGFRLHHRKTSAAVEVQIDQPASRFGFYAERTVLCPEPFTRVLVAPGQSMTWTIRMAFEGDL
jgi:hypothetical protein